MYGVPLIILLAGCAAGPGPAPGPTPLPRPVPPPAPIPAPTLPGEAPQTTEPRPAKTVIGYYPSWKRAEFDHTRIGYSFLTHIAHAFVWPDASGNLVVPKNFLYPELVSESHAHGIRILLSLGGYGNSTGFPGTASTSENRIRFIDQVVGFCRANGYDGVDLDWEFVADAGEREAFTALVRELAAALKNGDPPLILTMAAPTNNFWGRWIAFEEIAAEFDFIGFMTYGYHGSWSAHSGHNAPLRPCGGDDCGSVSETLSYALVRGVPPEKILLGIPFFGRTFDSPGLYEKFNRSESLPYKEIRRLPADGWILLRDGCAEVPYLVRADGKMVISFEDAQSVEAKCGYVQAVGAAGVIIWELSGDDWEGQPVLLEAVARSLAGR
jgi:chitinase